MEEPKNTNTFQVVVLGVIFDPAKRKILLGRRENDPQLKELTWCFPGGKLLAGESPDKKLKKRVKEKTGYDIKNLGTIFSRIYPEKQDLLSIYFLCEVFKGEELPADDLVELKWVSPEEVESHFQTSFHPELKEYILHLK